MNISRNCTTDALLCEVPDNRLLKISGYANVVCTLFMIASVSGFLFHWNQRWKWAMKNVGEHLMMSVQIGLCIAQIGFVENVVSGFSRSAHIASPPAGYSKSQIGYYNAPATPWCVASSYIWSYGALSCVCSATAMVTFVYVTLHTKVRIKKPDDLPTWLYVVAYFSPWVVPAIFLSILGAVGTEMGDINGGLYCGVRCPEQNILTGKFVNEGKSCHALRFIQLYGLMGLCFPFLFYFSYANISYINSHRNKMNEGKKKTSSEQREDKLYQAMTKLSYFTAIVAVIEMITFGSRLLGWIRNNPATEGIVGSAELAWPLCVPFWFFFFGYPAWLNGFKHYGGAATTSFGSSAVSTNA